MTPYKIFASSLFIASAVSSPMFDYATLSDRSSIRKRAAPRIGPGFNSLQMLQLNDAFRDALQLASKVTTRPRQFLYPVMRRHIDPGDFDKVLNVFSNITGDSDAKCSDLLGNILVLGDFPDEQGRLTCTEPNILAKLRDEDSGYPTLVLCDNAFKHGGINRGYGGIPLFPYRIPAIKRTNLDSYASWKMNTLGATILHEYAHFKMLVAPPQDQETEDHLYGAFNCQNKLDKRLAPDNADSYTWLAIENLWSVLCNKNFDPPKDSDDKYPGCWNMVCMHCKEERHVVQLERIRHHMPATAKPRQHQINLLEQSKHFSVQ